MISPTTQGRNMIFTVVHTLMEWLYAPARNMRSLFVRYSLALVLTAMALAVRLGIAPADAGLPFVTFFPAAALAAILGGIGPGMLATVLGAFLGSSYFMPPLSDHSGIAPVLIFVADEVLVCGAMEALHRYFEQMRRRSDELSALVERLNDANHELERFAYVASHDLQEPLRSIISFSQLLERKLLPEASKDCTDYLGYIVTSATRMNRLIQDILSFSRVTSQGVRFTRVSTPSACQAAIDNLHQAIGESGAQIEVGELPHVIGDGIQLMQVFQNLIGNAVKFRAPDRNPMVSVACEEDGGDWHFKVTDNGIGFDSQSCDIFELFKRLHHQTEFPGTGLGLAVCERIVRRHGGRIWAESVPNRGSVFHFTLPVVNEVNPANLEPQDVY